MIRQASSRLSVEAQAIMDGQTAVKQVVKDLYLRGYLWFTIEAAVRKVIKQTQSEIANDTLKADTAKSYILRLRGVFTTNSKTRPFSPTWRCLGRL